MSHEKDQKGLSRRAFLKNTGLTVAAATAGAGLLGPQAVGAQDAAPSAMNAELAAQKWSFEIPPDPIPESEITSTVEADIIVVGAGVSGLVAASAAVENGAKVVLISASSTPVYRGGSFQAPRSRHMTEAGIEPYDVDKFYRRELSAAGYNLDEAKWWKFYNDSEESVNWLIDKMEAAGYETVIEAANNSDPAGLAEPMYQPTAAHGWVDSEMRRGGMGAEFVVNTLAETAQAAGLEIYYKTIAKQLVREDNNTGRVTAVIAQGEDGAYTRYVGSKAVILATGDFSTDKEMMTKYCPWAMPLLDETGDRGYDNCFKIGGLFPGDGQKMGLWVGAAWQKTFPNAPMIGGGNTAANKAYGGHRGLMLNKYGQRFGNEDRNDSFTGVSIIHQPEMKAYAIWGANYAEGGAPWVNGEEYCHDSAPIPPEDVLAGWDAQAEAGSLAKANTVEEVIEMLGLPAEETKATVDRYNGFCETGADEDFYKRAEFLVPLAQGPFYGTRLGVGFLTVLGGLRTNVKMQVCDANDEPIPGLYNIGTMVGDFFANMYTFRVEGNNLGANCLTFGYVTGRDIANGTLA